MNANTQNFVSKSRKSKQLGQGMSEYIIIVALVAVGGIGVFSAFGGVIRQQVAGMATELSGGDGATSIKAAGDNSIAGRATADRAINMGTYAAQNTAAAVGSTNAAPIPPKTN